MGRKDIYAKQYIGDSAVFADLFNMLLYQGRPEIRPEQLSPLDPVELAAPYGKTGKGFALERIRDQIKVLSSGEDGRAAYLLLGIDAQAKTHYAMPVRNMLYDSLSYTKQVEELRRLPRQERDYGDGPEEFLSGIHRGERILPVITAVLNLSQEAWDGPVSLREMLEIRDRRLEPWIQDYKIHLIDPHRMKEEELDLFQTDLGMVFKWFRYGKDREKLEEAVRRDRHAHAVSREAIRVIESHTNSRFPEEAKKEEEEAVDMCLALDMMMEEAKAAGVSQGFNQGISQGENRLAQLILCLQKDGRISDMFSIAADEAMRNQLYHEYGIL